ncbi:hypothetical protein V2G26_010503 [Clonostachys chloroleuca]
MRPLAFLFATGIHATTISIFARADPTTTSQARVSFQSITGCHFHGTAQYCMAGNSEYRIIPETPVTATENAPASYTACHNHGTATYCMEPSADGEVQVVNADATITSDGSHATATGSSTTSGPSITAITDCHLSSSSLFCTASSTEYYVQTTVTATSDVPAQFTGCHSHGTDTYCMTETDEVAILLAEDVKSGNANPDEKHCHFHAGVEHCVGAGESENDSSTTSCERNEREYKIPIRIGMLFATLVASAVGVFGPILLSNFVQVKTNIVFIILKQFGTGIILSTAFAHLFTHASLMFGNSCLTGLEYEATTAAIVMAGLFISFVIEFVVSRLLRWQQEKEATDGNAELTPIAIAKAETTNVTIMEAGIIFHSLLIGVTTVVAGDSFYITLSIVIIFHQLFEGIALGTRIASLGYSTVLTKTSMVHTHAHDTTAPEVDRTLPCSVSMLKKLLMATGFALVTPVGMAIGIGVLHSFNGNDPSTIIAIGTLDALSAGILIWVGVVEMLAHDWMLGGDVTNANMLTTGLAMFSLVAGMVLMSFLGKWA